MSTATSPCPTAPSLGTRSYYGTKADEASFKKMAEAMFPLQIAEEWHKSWKGTGQFSRFPAVAADELWKRLAGDRLQPAEFALALVKLLHALEAMREGKPDAPVGDAFKAVNEMKAKVPMENGKPHKRFVVETGFHMGKWVQNFDHLAESLAKDGHIDDAEDFAAIEEF